MLADVKITSDYLLGNVNKRCLGTSGRKHTTTYTYKCTTSVTTMVVSLFTTLKKNDNS